MTVDGGIFSEGERKPGELGILKRTGKRASKRGSRCGFAKPCKFKSSYGHGDSNVHVRVFH